MQCYTEYILVCTQYKSVYTGTRSYIHVWQRTYWYKTVYTCMNALYLSIYAYERVHTNTSPYIYTHMNAVYLGTSQYIRVWHILQKCAWFELRTMDLMITARLFIPLRHEHWCFWSPPYDISATDWDLGMPQHVTCWLAWCRTCGAEPDEPLVLARFLNGVSRLSRPGRRGPIVSECHSLRLRLYLSPSHYALSNSARSLRPYTCSCKCTSYKTRCKTF